MLDEFWWLVHLERTTDREQPEGEPDTPAFLRIYVPDGHAAFARAIEAGATSVTEMTHLLWGDRVGRVRDPLGNLWWIQARVEDVDESEVNRRMSDPVWLERMAYVQGSLAFG